LGSDAYVGGMIDHEGASLNPLAYARGLARGAMREGARVFSATPALRYVRAGRGWQVETPQGRIACDAVVVATDAYTAGLAPTVARSLVTVHTNIICTDILPDDIARSILPGEQAVSDVRRILFYWHKDPQGRVLFGTRGQLAGPTGVDSFAHVQQAMISVYPQLAGQPIAFRWAGRVGLTRDFLPHIDQPEPGVWTAHGYCGRGVAMASAYGRLLAATMVAGKSAADLPVPNDPAPGLPPSPIKDIGLYATTQYYRLLDKVN
ncbi:MAG TPA: FAD-binding oxidoreductase, partial [Paenirhodobacter sp.]